MPKKISALVYTPANMNAIDGSSVWTQSITMALAEAADVSVTLLLSHTTTNDRMVGPLRGHRAISIVDPAATNVHENGRLTPDQAASWLRRSSPQVVVVRGTEVALRLAKEPGLRGKLWPYLTDIPQRPESVDNASMETMRTIMAASPLVLCQTEELSRFLEAHFPETRGKVRLLPPTLPENLRPNPVPGPSHEDLRLCYSGKFARLWKTYEMCDLPAQLTEYGIKATVTMVGDKINQDASWPKFPAEMKRKLETSPGVEWIGGVSREQSIAHMASAHIGLSWRSPELNGSLELSTKLLEYCAVATPPILNRTAMHEHIFGTDYPLFIDDESPAVDILVEATKDPAIYRAALERVSQIPSHYTLSKTTERLNQLLDEVVRSPSAKRQGGLMARLAGRRPHQSTDE